MKLTVLFIGLMVAMGFSVQEPTVVYLVGDSTCSEKQVNKYPETGWGMPFSIFFDESIRVDNRAKNGRSTKSFMAEGLWDDVMKTLKPGDYVFIQFGHNDEAVSKVERYTTPEQFQTNLRTYISDTRSRNAIPVLLTPVTRRGFENETLIDSHKQYAELTREVAQSENVPLIDMTAKSMTLVQSYGPEKSTLLYLQLQPGVHPNYPNGVKDNTHFNELGAREMAQLVLEGIRELELDLKNHVAGPKP